MKVKIVTTLPTRTEIVAGLTPRDVHPPLVRAENDAAKAERELEQLRRDLAASEHTVAEMPARCQRGEVPASRLTEALRQRDAAALTIASAETALVKARERVVAEEKLATIAVQHEVNRRLEQLERIAAEWSPVATELNYMAGALVAMLHPGAVCTSVDWPCAGRCDANRRQTASANAPAPVSLTWSKP